jgi:toxin ParE1/3/4
MARVVKREAAKRDLIRQWVWYAENSTFEVADRFLAAADSALADVAMHPGSGQPVFTRRTDLQGIRRVPVGDGFEKLLLFYFPGPDGVELVRVLHGNRDLAQMMDIEPIGRAV